MRRTAWALLVGLALFLPAGVWAEENPKTPDDANTAPEAKTNNKKKVANKKKDVDAIGERNVGSGVNFYSIEKEIALGKQLAQEIERQAKIIEDPVIAEYVNRIGQNLVRNSDAKVPFTIKVIDTDVPNAVSLPGGFFFVNSGLITLADTESEIAGAMAHEIAHVAARHGTRQATRGQVANFATIPLIFMGGWTGYGIRQAAGLVIPMGFLQFSRAFEREADSLGLQYLYKAGYDPNAMAEMFERMEKLEKTKPGTLSKLFSTHPMTQDRVASAQKEIQETLPPKPDYVINTSEYLDVKSRLLAMHAKRKVDDKDSNRPRLRKSSGGGTIPVDEGKKGGDSSSSSTGKDADDDRPVLKRR
jgi:predicted Zn-dependent protease